MHAHDLESAANAQHFVYICMVYMYIVYHIKCFYTFDGWPLLIHNLFGIQTVRIYVVIADWIYSYICVKSLFQRMASIGEDVRARYDM